MRHVQADGSAEARSLAAERLRDLTGREREIATGVAAGLTNAQIAERSFLSEATVKTHLGHAYDKLGVKDRAAAVAVAYERGLLGAG